MDGRPRYQFSPRLERGSPDEHQERLYRRIEAAIESYSSGEGSAPQSGRLRRRKPMCSPESYTGG